MRREESKSYLRAREAAKSVRDMKMKQNQKSQEAKRNGPKHCFPKRSKTAGNSEL